MTIHNQTFHELAMDYRGAVHPSVTCEAYDRLVEHVDKRIEELEKALQEIADGVFCDLKSVEHYAENALKEFK